MRAVRVVAIGLVVQATLVLAFVLPAHDPEPRDLPVAAPAAAAPGLQARFGGAVDVRPVASAAEARALVLDREVVGAVLGNEVLVASGASPGAAQLLSTAAAPGPAAGAARVQDLAPLDPDDGRGATLGAMMLPLVIACLPFGLLLWRSRLPRGPALAAGLAVAVLGGLSVAAIVQGLLGALPGAYLALASVLALAVASIALPVAGAVRLAGPPGFAAVAVLVFLVGNPASGATNGPDFLPSPWREVGGFLPPGATAEAVRSVTWFDGAGAGLALLVLALWAVAGAALLLLARPRPAVAAEA